MLLRPSDRIPCPADIEVMELNCQAASMVFRSTSLLHRLTEVGLPKLSAWQQTHGAKRQRLRGEQLRGGHACHALWGLLSCPVLMLSTPSSACRYQWSLPFVTLPKTTAKCGRWVHLAAGMTSWQGGYCLSGSRDPVGDSVSPACRHCMLGAPTPDSFRPQVKSWNGNTAADGVLEGSRGYALMRRSVVEAAAQLAAEL